MNEFAVELAKVTLMLARRLAHRDAEIFWEEHRDVLPGGDTSALEFEKDLPLDNLDDNILCRDALFTPWPEVEAKDIGPRQNHAKTWWQFWHPRPEVIALLPKLPRYIVCSRVTKRPVFEFVSPEIHPNEAVVAFTLPDDYSFGILQSGIHWEWFKARCSTLKADFRYTSDPVFDSFPWPQKPTLAQVQAVVKAARELRQLRRFIMEKNEWPLRELYRTLTPPATTVCATPMRCWTPPSAALTA